MGSTSENCAVCHMAPGRAVSFPAAYKYYAYHHPCRMRTLRYATYFGMPCACHPFRSALYPSCFVRLLQSNSRRCHVSRPHSIIRNNDKRLPSISRPERRFQFLIKACTPVSCARTHTPHGEHRRFTTSRMHTPTRQHVQPSCPPAVVMHAQATPPLRRVLTD